MSYAVGPPDGGTSVSDAPYGRAPSGRPYKYPPAGWVPAPAGGPASAPPPRSKARSTVWIWIVAGAAALLVLILVAVIAVVSWLDNEAKLSDAAATTTVSMPARAGGLVRSTHPQSLAASRDVIKQLRAAGFANPQAAGYAKTKTAQAEAIAFGGATPVHNPDDELAATFRKLGKSGLPVTGVSAYPAGPLGGSLKCAELDKPAIGSMCGWADHGAIVFVVVGGRAPAQAAPLVLRLRGDIEHRRS